MKRKGFTLIEILAVIVIIAIIALITIPLIMNVIEKSNKNALVDSAYGIIEAGRLYYVENMEEKELTGRYDFEVKDGKFTLKTDSTKELKFTGKMPKTGMLQIHGDGKEAVGICTDTYCACKSVSELKVTIKDGNCNINEETGEIGNTEEISSQKLKELEDKITALEKKQTIVGTVISYMGENVPKGYLACNGATYNISDYKDLAEQIKKEFGSYNKFGGDGTTTFAVPDLRGEFLRGTGTNSHKNQGDGAEVGDHQHATELVHMGIDSSNGQLYFLNIADAVPGQAYWGNQFDKMLNASIYGKQVSGSRNASVKFSEVYQQANPNLGLVSTRPTNTSVLYCIKY